VKNRGGETKSAIRQEALTQFCRLGYHEANLEDIGHALGITRSAILFHFGTKADLLAEIVRPLEEDLDRILGRNPDERALPPGRRRRFLGELISCFLEHRAAASLVVGTGNNHLPDEIETGARARIARCRVLLAGPRPTAHDRVVLGALTGVMTRPLLDPQLDVADPWTHALLLDASLHLARRLGQRPEVAETPAVTGNSPEWSHSLLPISE
jgi:AcrR family transcriptional regulator